MCYQLLDGERNNEVNSGSEMDTDVLPTVGW